MKNSIHDYFVNKHANDPNISFEDCIGGKYPIQQSTKRFLLPTAFAASILLLMLLLPLFENFSSGIFQSSENATPIQNTPVAVAQSNGSAEQEIRPAPRNSAPRGERVLPTETVPAVYPEAAIEQGIEGWIVISLTVSAAGEVVDPYVEDAEPAGVFDESALEAIRQFTFRPKMVDGEAVTTSGVQYLFRYHLDD